MIRSFVWLSVAILFLSCTRKADLTVENRLDSDIQTMEKEVQTLDEKIKTLAGDRGRQLLLTNERELLHSRLERLKAKRGTP